MLEKIKNDLPNFPDEVIKSWLEPYANSEGWPPSNSDRWAGILFGRDLTFWNKVSWSKKSIDLSNITLSDITQRSLRGMYSGYVNRENNLYNKMIPDGPNRFYKSLAYIMEHGIFPNPPCLLLKNGNYSVVDGNHRVLAWQKYYEITKNFKGADEIKEVNSFKEAVRKKYNINKLVPLLELQEVWLAKMSED